MRGTGYEVYLLLRANEPAQAFIGVRPHRSPRFVLSGHGFKEDSPESYFRDQATHNFRLPSLVDNRLTFQVFDRETGRTYSHSFNVGSVPCRIQFEPLAESRNVCRCLASESSNGCVVESSRITPSTRRREAEASKRLWDQVALFPSAHHDRKKLVLRDCQIDSDVTRSHVAMRCLTAAFTSGRTGARRRPSGATRVRPFRCLSQLPMGARRHTCPRECPGQSGSTALDPVA